MAYADISASAKLSRALRCILLSSTAWILSTNMVLSAQIVSQATKSVPNVTQKPDTLLFAQVSDNTNNTKAVLITNVKINSTDKGLELILETSQGKQLQVVGSPDSNNSNSFIADIPNTQLRLSSESEFRQKEPVSGITEITVTNKDKSTIRITVTGEAGKPKAELFESQEGLIFNFTPVTSSLRKPITPPEEQSTPTTEKKPKETPPPSQENGEDAIELIVTAQKTPENLQEVPISITVLDEDQLESGDVSSFDDVAKNTPNFSVFGSGTNRLSPFYSMRGISNFNAFSRDGVGIYVDDVP